MAGERQGAARAAVDHVMARLPHPITTQRRSVLIGGWNRIGKGLVARDLAASHGFAPVALDALRRFHGNIPDPALRSDTFRQILEELLQRCPTGLCIEGHDLVLASSSPRFEDRTPEQISVTSMVSLRASRGALCVVLGDSVSSLTDRGAAIRAHGARGWCWTSSHPLWQGERFAHRVRDILVASAGLKALARQHDLPYFELPAKDFRRHVADIASRITALAALP
ncbi:MAG: hypothetical protein U1F47_00795 [Hyphomicrobiales bacterium]